jgi:hypothetical protein
MRHLPTLLTQACNRGIQRHGYRNFRRMAFWVLLCANLALLGACGLWLYRLVRGGAHIIVAMWHGAESPSGADLRDTALPILAIICLPMLYSVLTLIIYKSFAGWCQRRMELPQTISMHEQLRRFGRPFPP